MLRELVHCSSFLSWFLFFFSSLNHFYLDHEQLLLLLEPLLPLVLELLSSAAIHPVGTTASLAATTVSASESPLGVVESDDGEAVAAELLGAARLLVVVAVSSSN
jgi:hypothetical protein